MKQQKKDTTKWKIVTAVMSVIAVCGVGFGVFQIVENNKEIDKLKTEILSLKEQQQIQATEKVQSGSTTTISDSISNTDVNNTPSSAKKYLEPEGWDVRFVLILMA